MGSERCKEETLEHVLDDTDESCDECDQLKSRLEKYRLTCRTCHICKEICSGRAELNRHFLKHETETDQCLVCREQFSNQRELLQHFRKMHIEYLKAKDPALLEEFPCLGSSSKITLSDISGVHNFSGSRTAFDNAVSVPVSLKNCNPPTDIKKNEILQMSRGVNSGSIVVNPSKQSANVQKHVSVASIDQNVMTSNLQHQVSSSIKKYKMRNASSSTRYKSRVPNKDFLSSVNNAKSTVASHDMILKDSITQSTSNNLIKKPRINKKKVPSVQLQEIPVMSSPTAQLPKLTMGETLNSLAKFNITKSIETFAPVNSDLNVLQHSPCNRKIVNVSSECMKVLKESLLKNSSAVNCKYVCIAVPPKMLYDLKLMPMKSEFEKNIKSVARTTAIEERKGSDAINQPNIEKILQEDRRRKEEKEKIKKKEKILQKMLMKYEEKEEKKLIKYFQKRVTSHIKKKQGNLNEMEKNLVDTAGNKPKLLEVVRHLKCKDQSDVGILMEYFGMKRKFKKKPARNSSIMKFEQKPGMSSVPTSVNPDISINIPNGLKVEESDKSFNSFYKEQVCSTPKREENLAYESESSYLLGTLNSHKTIPFGEDLVNDMTIFNSFYEEQVCSTPKREENLVYESESSYLLDNLNSHKTIPYGEDPFTDMSIITDETFTIPCPCGKVSCIGFL
ncbi:hypothetical protein TNIN_456461 [Trichonephila inaurata madagascariensis]|uniref:C2H2-type domain-containing protein n=1 Tax=Trichonephila inaurata madagascariensis TaxID=2747483 RepID=A0A8X6XAC7_9ARAC|nr:hypothetical protein TNIN_456461 [Trichonephila inaurata madagascariensis]